MCIFLDHGRIHHIEDDLPEGQDHDHQGGGPYQDIPDHLLQEDILQDAQEHIHHTEGQ